MDKSSKELKQEALQEENDFIAMGKMKKAIRQERLERFEGYIEKLERQNLIVMPFDGSKHTIDTQMSEYGVIDYYPKANKVLIRKQNRWIEHGLKWLVKTFLN